LRGASGEPKGVHAGQVARGLADSGERAGDRAGVRARGCGPGHDGQRVSLAVTAYGRQAVVGLARLGFDHRLGCCPRFFVQKCESLC
jgi:hypothetical protein